LVDFSVGKNFISARYVVDSYSEGAAHHNHSWFSINYNIHEKRIYWLKDIFQFSDHKDSLDFIRMVGRNLDNHTIEMDVTTDSVDVFIRNDNEFLIGPPLSWADGMRTATLSVDSLWNFFYQRWE
ncbi:MAG: hypothetical protein ACHQF2_03505, partial [Flavobacteriales bacterium]